MRDILVGVTEAVGEVIRGVDAPSVRTRMRRREKANGKETRREWVLVASAVMGNVFDAVGDEIPHDRVGALHVHLHTQRCRTLRELAVLHVLKEAEVLLNRTIAEKNNVKVQHKMKKI